MSILLPIAALLISVFLLICGNALIGVVTPIRASLDGFGDLTVGLLGSAYFAGMLLGTLKTPKMVRRAGHIRAFAAFVAIAVVAVDVLPVLETPVAWLLSRAVTGFVLAGVYVVVESWINGTASNDNRGGLYAVYQLVNFSATAVGQLLMRGLDPLTALPFTVGSALYALAVVPLAMTRSDPPDLPRSVKLSLSSLQTIAPISLAGAFIAGAANGASISLAPVYALQIGVAPEAVPYFTAAIVLGCALGIYPVGRLSDHIDRRLIMAVMMGAGAVFEFGLAVVHPVGGPLLALGFLVGLTTYTLYTLAVSTANDGAAKSDMVLISAGMLFIYCIGAVASPAIASLAMHAFGPSALFWLNGGCHALLVALAIVALRQPARTPTGEEAAKS